MSVSPRIDISRIKVPVYVKIGDILSLNAHISGSPAPRVSWYVGQEKVTDGVKYRLKQHGYTYTLQVREITEEINKGVTVVAVNQAGRDKQFIDCKLYRVLRRRRHIRRAKSQTLPPEAIQMSEPRKTIRLFRQGDAGSVKSLPMGERRSGSVGSNPEDVIYYTANVSHGAESADQGVTPRTHSHGDLLASHKYYSLPPDHHRMSSTDDVFHVVDSPHTEPIAMAEEPAYTTGSMRRPTTPTRNIIQPVESPEQDPASKENRSPQHGTVRQVKRSKNPNRSHSPNRGEIRETQGLSVAPGDAYIPTAQIHNLQPQSSPSASPYTTRSPTATPSQPGDSLHHTRPVMSAYQDSPFYSSSPSRKKKTMSLPPRTESREVDDSMLTLPPSEPALPEHITPQFGYGTIPKSPPMLYPSQTEPPLLQRENEDPLATDSSSKKKSKKKRDKDGRKKKEKTPPTDTDSIISETSSITAEPVQDSGSPKKKRSKSKSPPKETTSQSVQTQKEPEKDAKKEKKKLKRQKEVSSVHEPQIQGVPSVPSSQIQPVDEKKYRTQEHSIDEAPSLQIEPSEYRPEGTYIHHPKVMKTEAVSSVKPQEQVPLEETKPKKKKSKNPFKKLLSRSKKPKDKDKIEDSTDSVPTVTDSESVGPQNVQGAQPEVTFQTTLNVDVTTPQKPTQKEANPESSYATKDDNWDSEFIQNTSLPKIETTFDTDDQKRPMNDTTVPLETEIDEPWESPLVSTSPLIFDHQSNGHKGDGPMETAIDDPLEVPQAITPDTPMETNIDEPWEEEMVVANVSSPVETAIDESWDSQYISETSTQDKTWDEEFLGLSPQGTGENVWSVNGVKMSNICGEMLQQFPDGSNQQQKPIETDLNSDLGTDTISTKIHDLVSEINNYTGREATPPTERCSPREDPHIVFEPLNFSSPIKDDDSSTDQRANSEPPTPLSKPPRKWHNSEGAIGIGRRKQMNKHASAEDVGRGRPRARTGSRASQPSPGRVRIKVEHTKTVTTESIEDITTTLSGSSRSSTPSLNTSLTRPYSSTDAIQMDRSLNFDRDIMSTSADDVFISEKLSPTINRGYTETDLDIIHDTETEIVTATQEQIGKVDFKSTVFLTTETTTEISESEKVQEYPPIVERSTLSTKVISTVDRKEDPINVEDLESKEISSRSNTEVILVADKPVSRTSESYREFKEVEIITPPKNDKDINQNTLQTRTTVTTTFITTTPKTESSDPMKENEIQSFDVVKEDCLTNQDNVIFIDEEVTDNEDIQADNEMSHDATDARTKQNEILSFDEEIQSSPSLAKDEFLDESLDNITQEEDDTRQNEDVMSVESDSGKELESVFNKESKTVNESEIIDTQPMFSVEMDELKQEHSVTQVVVGIPLTEETERAKTSTVLVTETTLVTKVNEDVVENLVKEKVPEYSEEDDEDSPVNNLQEFRCPDDSSSVLITETITSAEEKPATVKTITVTQTETIVQDTKNTEDSIEERISDAEVQDSKSDSFISDDNLSIDSDVTDDEMDGIVSGTYDINTPSDLDELVEQNIILEDEEEEQNVEKETSQEWVEEFLEKPTDDKCEVEQNDSWSKEFTSVTTVLDKPADDKNDVEKNESWSKEYVSVTTVITTSEKTETDEISAVLEREIISVTGNEGVNDVQDTVTKEANESRTVSEIVHEEILVEEVPVEKLPDMVEELQSDKTLTLDESTITVVKTVEVERSQTVASEEPLPVASIQIQGEKPIIGKTETVTTITVVETKTEEETNGADVPVTDHTHQEIDQEQLSSEELLTTKTVIQKDDEMHDSESDSSESQDNMSIDSDVTDDEIDGIVSGSYDISGPGNLDDLVEQNEVIKEKEEEQNVEKEESPERVEEFLEKPTDDKCEIEQNNSWSKQFASVTTVITTTGKTEKGIQDTVTKESYELKTEAEVEQEERIVEKVPLKLPDEVENLDTDKTSTPDELTVTIVKSVEVDRKETVASEEPIHVDSIQIQGEKLIIGKTETVTTITVMETKMEEETNGADIPLTEDIDTIQERDQEQNDGIVSGSSDISSPANLDDLAEQNEVIIEKDAEQNVEKEESPEWVEEFLKKPTDDKCEVEHHDSWSKEFTSVTTVITTTGKTEKGIQDTVTKESYELKTGAEVEQEERIVEEVPLKLPDEVENLDTDKTSTPDELTVTIVKSVEVDRKETVASEEPISVDSIQIQGEKLIIGKTETVTTITVVETKTEEETNGADIPLTEDIDTIQERDQEQNDGIVSGSSDISSPANLDDLAEQNAVIVEKDAEQNVEKEESPERVEEFLEKPTDDKCEVEHHDSWSKEFTSVTTVITTTEKTEKGIQDTVTEESYELKSGTEVEHEERIVEEVPLKLPDEVENLDTDKTSTPDELTVTIVKPVEVDRKETVASEEPIPVDSIQIQGEMPIIGKTETVTTITVVETKTEEETNGADIPLTEDIDTIQEIDKEQLSSKEYLTTDTDIQKGDDGEQDSISNSTASDDNMSIDSDVTDDAMDGIVSGNYDINTPIDLDELIEGNEDIDVDEDEQDVDDVASPEWVEEFLDKPIDDTREIKKIDLLSQEIVQEEILVEELLVKKLPDEVKEQDVEPSMALESSAKGIKEVERTQTDASEEPLPVDSVQDESPIIEKTDTVTTITVVDTNTDEETDVADIPQKEDDKIEASTDSGITSEDHKLVSGSWEDDFISNREENADETSEEISEMKDDSESTVAEWTPESRNEESNAVVDINVIATDIMEDEKKSLTSSSIGTTVTITTTVTETSATDKKSDLEVKETVNKFEENVDEETEDTEPDMKVTAEEIDEERTDENNSEGAEDTADKHKEDEMQDRLPANREKEHDISETKDHDDSADEYSNVEDEDDIPQEDTKPGDWTNEFLSSTIVKNQDNSDAKEMYSDKEAGTELPSSLRRNSTTKKRVSWADAFVDQETLQTITKTFVTVITSEKDSEDVIVDPAEEDGKRKVQEEASEPQVSKKESYEEELDNRELDSESGDSESDHDLSIDSDVTDEETDGDVKGSYDFNTFVDTLDGIGEEEGEEDDYDEEEEDEDDEEDEEEEENEEEDTGNVVEVEAQEYQDEVQDTVNSEKSMDTNFREERSSEHSVTKTSIITETTVTTKNNSQINTTTTTVVTEEKDRLDVDSIENITELVESTDSDVTVDKDIVIKEVEVIKTSQKIEDDITEENKAETVKKEDNLDDHKKYEVITKEEKDKPVNEKNGDENEENREGGTKESDEDSKEEVSKEVEDSGSDSEEEGSMIEEPVIGDNTKVEEKLTYSVGEYSEDSKTVITTTELEKRITTTKIVSESVTSELPVDEITPKKAIKEDNESKDIIKKKEEKDKPVYKKNEDEKDENRVEGTKESDEDNKEAESESDSEEEGSMIEEPVIGKDTKVDEEKSTYSEGEYSEDSKTVITTTEFEKRITTTKTISEPVTSEFPVDELPSKEAIKDDNESKDIVKKKEEKDKPVYKKNEDENRVEGTKESDEDNKEAESESDSEEEGSMIEEPVIGKDTKVDEEKSTYSEGEYTEDSKTVITTTEFEKRITTTKTVSEPVTSEFPVDELTQKEAIKEDNESKDIVKKKEEKDKPVYKKDEDEKDENRVEGTKESDELSKEAESESDSEEEGSVIEEPVIGDSTKVVEEKSTYSEGEYSEDSKTVITTTEFEKRITTTKTVSESVTSELPVDEITPKEAIKEDDESKDVLKNKPEEEMTEGRELLPSTKTIIATELAPSSSTKDIDHGKETVESDNESTYSESETSYDTKTVITTTGYEIPIPASDGTAESDTSEIYEEMFEQTMEELEMDIPIHTFETELVSREEMLRRRPRPLSLALSDSEDIPEMEIYETSEMVHFRLRRYSTIDGSLLPDSPKRKRVDSISLSLPEDQIVETRQRITSALRGIMGDDVPDDMNENREEQEPTHYSIPQTTILRSGRTMESETKTEVRDVFDGYEHVRTSSNTDVKVTEKQHIVVMTTLDNDVDNDDAFETTTSSEKLDDRIPQVKESRPATSTTYETVSSAKETSSGTSEATTTSPKQSTRRKRAQSETDKFPLTDIKLNEAAVVRHKRAMSESHVTAMTFPVQGDDLLTEGYMGSIVSEVVKHAIAQSILEDVFRESEQMLQERDSKKRAPKGTETVSDGTKRFGSEDEKSIQAASRRSQEQLEEASAQEMEAASVEEQVTDSSQESDIGITDSDLDSDDEEGDRSRGYDKSTPLAETVIPEDDEEVNEEKDGKAEGGLETELGQHDSLIQKGVSAYVDQIMDEAVHTIISENVQQSLVEMLQDSSDDENELSTLKEEEEDVVNGVKENGYEVSDISNGKTDILYADSKLSSSEETIPVSHDTLARVIVDDTIQRCVVELAEETMAKELVTNIVHQSVHELNAELQHLQEILSDESPKPDEGDAQVHKKSRQDIKTFESKAGNSVIIAFHKEEGQTQIVNQSRVSVSRTSSQNTRRIRLNPTERPPIAPKVMSSEKACGDVFGCNIDPTDDDEEIQLLDEGALTDGNHGGSDQSLSSEDSFLMGSASAENGSSRHSKNNEKEGDLDMMSTISEEPLAAGRAGVVADPEIARRSEDDGHRQADILLYDYDAAPIDDSVDKSHDIEDESVDSAFRLEARPSAMDNKEVSYSYSSSTFGSLTESNYDKTLKEIKAEVQRLETILLAEEDSKDSHIVTEINNLKEEYKTIAGRFTHTDVSEQGETEDTEARTRSTPFNLSNLSDEQVRSLQAVKKAGLMGSTEELLKLEDMLRFGGCKDEDVREILEMVDDHLKASKSKEAENDEETVEEVKEEDLDHIMEELARVMPPSDSAANNDEKQQTIDNNETLNPLEISVEGSDAEDKCLDTSLCSERSCELSTCVDHGPYCAHSLHSPSVDIETSFTSDLRKLSADITGLSPSEGSHLESVMKDSEQVDDSPMDIKADASDIPKVYTGPVLRDPAFELLYQMSRTESDSESLGDVLEANVDSVPEIADPEDAAPSVAKRRHTLPTVGSQGSKSESEGAKSLSLSQQERRREEKPKKQKDTQEEHHSVDTLYMEKAILESVFSNMGAFLLLLLALILCHILDLFCRQEHPM